MPPDLNPSDATIAGAIFHADADDAANPPDGAEHPALLVLRVMPGDYALDPRAPCPPMYWLGLLRCRSGISSRSQPLSPARTVVARPEGVAVVYALALGADDWRLWPRRSSPGYNALELINWRCAARPLAGGERRGMIAADRSGRPQQNGSPQREASRFIRLIKVDARRGHPPGSSVGATGRGVFVGSGVGVSVGASSMGCAWAAACAGRAAWPSATA